MGCYVEFPEISELRSRGKGEVERRSAHEWMKKKKKKDLCARESLSARGGEYGMDEDIRDGLGERRR